MKSMETSEEYKEFLNDLSGYYHHQERKEDTLPIGKRLKKIREMQNLSIERFSQISKIDINLLEQIEKQEVFPDLGTIKKLSMALRIATDFLLGEESGYSYSLIRKQERKNIRRYIAGTKERPNYHYQSLSGGIKNRHMDSFIVTLSAESENDELSSHDGEEFIVVIEGTIKVILGNKEEVLKEGDSIYYLSTIPHNVKNISGDKDAVIIAVLYTGN